MKHKVNIILFFILFAVGYSWAEEIVNQFHLIEVEGESYILLDIHNNTTTVYYINKITEVKKTEVNATFKGEDVTMVKPPGTRIAKVKHLEFTVLPSGSLFFLNGNETNFYNIVDFLHNKAEKRK